DRLDRQQEARPVHDAGTPLEDGLEERPVLLRIELQIRVLDQDDVAGRVAQAEADGAALADVDAVGVHAHARIAAPGAGRDRLARVVARSVIGDDDFGLDRAEVHGEHALDDRADRLLFVVDRNDDGELHEYDSLTWAACRGASRAP